VIRLCGIPSNSAGARLAAALDELDAECRFVNQQLAVVVDPGWTTTAR
jgi:hypothetical protein